ncbi:retrovirus-related pol polyprotein from transposon TNT 1-94 [Tanacetum coccineum]
MTIIGTKWVFRNKLDENGVVSRNKARLVAQGHNQQEGIDYDETYAPLARLESIRILIAYACALDFKLFQMDVKNAFLNGFINEEVYMAQPPGFIYFEKPDHVYKLKKALYGLKQVPKAWYDRLKAFLIKQEYKMGMVDNTLFNKKKSSNLIIVQIYVDDIIFGLTYQDMCDEFAKIIHEEFEMSMMGYLNFFLGLQIKQMKYGIFFNQSKYIKEMLKKFRLKDSKPMKTPMSSDTKLTKDEECESVDSTKYRGMIGILLYLTASMPNIMFSVCLCARFQEDPKTSHLEVVKRIFLYIKVTTHLGWYPKGTGIETIVYVDSDHARDYVDQKSTSDITFVGCCLTSWFSKKQTALAIFTTEAEYVSAKKACQQALWMKQALIDYDVQLDDVPIMYVMGESPELYKQSYVLYERVMIHLTAQQERKTQRDRGTRRGHHSTSSSTFDQPSSSHLNDDDDDGNDEGTSRASKCIATGTEDSPLKLKKASKEVCRDPDESALLDFQLHDGRFVKMTHEEIDQYLEKTEKVKIIELSKLKIGKVVVEEFKAVEVTIKGGNDFLKHHAAILKEHNEKVTKYPKALILFEVDDDFEFSANQLARHKSSRLRFATAICYTEDSFLSQTKRYDVQILSDLAVCLSTAICPLRFVKHSWLRLDNRSSLRLVIL